MIFSVSRFFYRFLDACFDSRMPWAVPFLYLKKEKMKKRLKNIALPQEVFFSLTIDTEQDHGSGSRKHFFSTLNAFEETFLPFTEKHRLPSTLFLQGDIPEKASQQTQAFLKKMIKHDHEIGLHGYHHELWGKPTWFSPETYLPTKERMATLKKCIANFKKIGLPRPASFRAPNLIVDPSTYRALQQASFAYDSSSPVFKGSNLLPHHKSDVKVVPVSTDPVAHIRWHRFFPVGEYRVLNLYQLCHQPEEEIWKMVEHILQYQIANGIQPHLVFLAHSWELVLWKEAYVKLDQFVKKLRDTFTLSPLTFSRLCDRLL
ncbi:MAG: hypothetical protein UW70_C0037G0014 [Candidatus Peregrinibacteria bacterium GW2011_GWA2_44_7]|nr:MAG: hypothetical protein UW70_C0037G0014 [Candidatus Peregrinibacteria bacterium GW2011_GWA2_44_7]